MKQSDSLIIKQCYNVTFLLNETKVSQFYVLTKTHKPYNPSLPLGYPGRPIAYACVSLNENASAFFWIAI